ncbi:uncharacterized protein AKAME5_000270600 [Lates japonicus]|uniref:C-type lectin domain-containing protein n=1 Tax=Lates japonicus TaxID=270547 RepID=A0AAD3M6W9_LATJO|nr:uncharacterized protein AKAME5_000270600 [Lates japonicus]
MKKADNETLTTSSKRNTSSALFNLGVVVCVAQVMNSPTCVLGMGSGNEPLVLCEVRLCGSKEDSPFVLINQKMTWADALYYCRDRHTDLASILDEEDQDWAVLMAKEAQTHFVWLGLRYTCTLDFWFWVEDHRLEYNNWAPGENTQECDMSAAMMKEKDNLWFRKFDNETFNFICAK